MKRHPNCDGMRCNAARGEVRLLPTGGGANAILCRTCFAYEIRFRRERNRDLGDSFIFDLPAWEDLTVYEGAPVEGARKEGSK